jgi:predicted MFS family arabinose efflux permease
LAASAPSEKRSSVFALKYFLVTIGLAIGGGLGGWIPGGLEAAGLVNHHEALSVTMVAIALMDVMSAGIFLSVPAPLHEANPIRPLVTARAPISARALLGLLAFCVPGAGLSLGHNSIRPFLSLFFTEAHGLSEATTGTLLSLLALAGGIGSLAMPHLGQRFGPVRAIVVMRGICAAMVAAWFLPFGLIGVIPAMVIYYGIADGTEAIFISEAMHRLDTQQRIWFSGLNAMAWSLMSSGGTLLSGFNQDRHDGAFGVAFMVGAGGYVLSLLWVAGLFRFAPENAPA